MPRVLFLVTTYECERCGERIRERVGKEALCHLHEREGEPPEPPMMRTVLGLRPDPSYRPPSRFEAVPMRDIGPVADRSLTPVLRTVWMADARAAA